MGVCVMLPWQRLQIADKTKFLGNLLFLSGLLHISACFFLLFVSSDQKAVSSVEISAHATQAIVRLMPSGGVKKGAGSGGAKGSGAQKSSQRMGSAKPKTRLATTKSVVKKKEVAKKKNVLKNKKTKTKKTKKVAQKKVVKKESILQEPAKQALREKSEPIQKKEAVETSVKTALEVVDKVAVTSHFDATAHAVAQDNVQYVTLSEFDQVQFESVIQEAIACVWSPPAGIDSSTMCKATLTIGWDGKILESKIEEKSDILIYDIAVEQALAQFEAPRQLWGKTLQIIFKP